MGVCSREWAWLSTCGRVGRRGPHHVGVAVPPRSLPPSSAQRRFAPQVLLASGARQARVRPSVRLSPAGGWGGGAGVCVAAESLDVGRAAAPPEAAPAFRAQGSPTPRLGGPPGKEGPACLSTCLSVSLSVCLSVSVSLSVSQSACVSLVSQPVCQSVSVSLSICVNLSVCQCQSVSVCVCLSV